MYICVRMGVLIKHNYSGHAYLINRLKGRSCGRVPLLFDLTAVALNVNALMTHQKFTSIGHASLNTKRIAEKKSRKLWKKLSREKLQKCYALKFFKAFRL